MRMHIGSDHAGFELKGHLETWLSGAGHEVVDHGASTYDDHDDYPPYCLRAADAVTRDPGSLGIVLGGSGNGEQMAANKVAGARAALVWSEETARLAREHNDANVIAFGGRIVGTEVARACVREFLDAEFQGGRHVPRIAKIAHIEAEEVGR
jgi:ribose 5-phosphate isomerase B